MPFINGRYHVNPIMGAALEAAREAEASMLALQNHKQRDGGSADSTAADSNDDDSANASSSTASAPIHHVEIEASEIVPSHSGRATSGFIARIHRSQPQASAGSRTAQMSTKPETHVFSNHGDLINFLHDELSKH